MKGGNFISMRIKRRYKAQGYSLLSSIVYVAVLIMMFSGGITAGYHIINNYKVDSLQRQCEAIDRSLQMYSKMHKAVLLNSVSLDDETNKLKYYHTRIYPDTLEELGTIQDEQGYFSQDIDLTQFTYTVTKKSNGSMTYRLGVTLPNGKFYTSPQSDKEL